MKALASLMNNRLEILLFLKQNVTTGIIKINLLSSF
jgi:hypothetical protein